MVQKFMVEKFMIEKSGVEKSLGLESSWLKSLGLKGLGLKLGVEKSGVEMSFNRWRSVVQLRQLTCHRSSSPMPMPCCHKPLGTQTFFCVDYKRDYIIVCVIFQKNITHKLVGPIRKYSSS